MIIKQYEDRYFHEVLLLHKIAMENVGAYKGDGPWDDDLKDINKHYLDNDGEFLIAVEGQKLVGMGAFRKVSTSVAEIKRMRVAPAHQGKAIGKLVLSKLEESARDKGYSILILETSAKQVAANALYMGCGFVGFKKEYIDGYDCTWYEKKINTSS